MPFLFLVHSAIHYLNSDNTTNYEEYLKDYYEKVKKIEEEQKDCEELTQAEQLQREEVEKSFLKHTSPKERDEDISRLHKLPFANKIQEANLPHEATNYVTEKINQEICSCLKKVVVPNDSIGKGLDSGTKRNILKNNINNENFTFDYSKLIYLYLSYILVDAKDKSLPPEVLTLGSLETLLADHNEIEILPTNISLLENLKYLSLKDNNIRVLPKDLSELQHLEKLNLSKNQIDLTILKGGVPNLKTLDLSDNKLTILPKVIRQNKKLQELIVSNNSITSIEKFEKGNKPKDIKNIDLRDNGMGIGKKRKPINNIQNKERLLREYKGKVKLGK